MWRLPSCAGLTQSINAALAIGAYERRTGRTVARTAANHRRFRPQAASRPDEDLLDLIAERYERASGPAGQRAAIIVTSNLDFDEWDHAFATNRLLASAARDRLRHNAYCIELDRPSSRDPKVAPASKKGLAKGPVFAAR